MQGDTPKCPMTQMWWRPPKGYPDTDSSGCSSPGPPPPILWHHDTLEIMAKSQVLRGDPMNEVNFLSAGMSGQFLTLRSEIKSHYRK
jgi:hypothetical protein